MSLHPTFRHQVETSGFFIGRDAAYGGGLARRWRTALAFATLGAFCLGMASGGALFLLALTH